MEDVGKSIAENFMGNFVNIARGGGKYRYPKGISPQTSMATKFWAKVLPYMASRKLLTTALIFYALRKKKNNIAPIIEVQETEILDILVESLVNNELNLAEDYNDAYRMFMAWMNIFENYVEKNSYEQWQNKNYFYSHINIFQKTIPEYIKENAISRRENISYTNITQG